MLLIMSKILFIVEGESAEVKYIQQFIEYHDEQMIENGNHVTPIVVQCYGTLIYDLYKKISDQMMEDEFETIPVLVDILKSKNISYDEQLNNYDEFSDIFLFFDLDAHYYVKYDDPNEEVYSRVKQLIEFFDESTEKGKLLISYPMFEALKCFKDEFITENSGQVNVFHIYEVKKNSSKTSFKGQVGNLTSKTFNTPTYSREKVEKLVKYFVMCSHYLVGSEKMILDSDDIFENQYKKFIEPFNKVLILSAFPNFITDIFGVAPYIDATNRKISIHEV